MCVFEVQLFAMNNLKASFLFVAYGSVLRLVALLNGLLSEYYFSRFFHPLKVRFIKDNVYDQRFAIKTSMAIFTSSFFFFWNRKYANTV